jgi:hypothetical protein
MISAQRPLIALHQPRVVLSSGYASEISCLPLARIEFVGAANYL